jgi:hypothetical protein
MARDLAMATGRRTWVDFHTSSNSYDMYIEDPDDPGRSNRIRVAHPVTGGNFSVNLNTGEYEDVRIDYVYFLFRSEVEFDWEGRPYNGLGIPLLLLDGRVRLRAGSETREVRVTPFGSCVREQ